MSVLVVGAGTMGRWLGATLDGPVAFTDADEAAATAAAEAIPDARTVPVAPESSGRGEFDLVCIAVPMTAVETVIAEQASRASEAIVDVAGEMAAPVAAMREHAPDLERLSLHPLFAPVNAPGSVAAVHDEPGPVTTAVRESLETAGNDVFETTVEEHDDAMNSVQGATHAAILAWRLAVDDVRPEFHTPLSRELETLAAHVTGQNPEVYVQIAERYDGGRDALAEAAALLAQADDEAFCDAFERARQRAEAADATAQGDGGSKTDQESDGDRP